jgi:hypothetical protein
MTETWVPVVHAPAATLFGALQRGLGRGAIRAAAGEDEGVEAVLRCLERDQRWDTQVEDRDVYLARLVRDLGVPVERLLTLLREPLDDDGFHNVAGVLETLGRSGDRDAVDGVRAYVADGPRWVEVLELIADHWPREHWDDLLTVARDRLPGLGEQVWRSRPWTDWATTDAVVAAAIIPEKQSPRDDRLLKDKPAEALVAALGKAEVGPQMAALLELNARGAQPALLPLLERLPTRIPSPAVEAVGGFAVPGSPMERLVAPGPLRGPLARAVRMLQERALPLARQWAVDQDHPMCWRGTGVLAAHGDESDLPVLLAAWDRLDDDPEDLCGYDILTTGLARICGPGGRCHELGDGPTVGVVRRLHELWVTPHSHERAAYLRALLVLDPAGVEPLLVEGLWDCEAAVREIAAERVPLSPAVRRRLALLRDDPIEEDEVRAAATARIG